MATLFGKSSKRKRSALPSRENDKIASGNDEMKNDLTLQDESKYTVPSWASFDDLGLADPLVATCKSLGFTKPTPVQRKIIPFLLQEEKSHVLALAATGSGKTASFVLPILHRLALDPYGIYAVILTPTRELAKQIHQQVLALGSCYRVQSVLVVGGLDMVRQSCELDNKPHVVVATPGRFAELLRGPNPPRLSHVRYMVLDEADRLLAAKSGFEKDVAELLLQTSLRAKQQTLSNRCQTLLFSATLTRSLESIEEMAGAGLGRLPLKKFVIREDGQENTKKKKKKKVQRSEEADTDKDAQNDEQWESESEEKDSTPSIPEGLKQEDLFMPARGRDAYWLTAIRTLMANGGRNSNEKVMGTRGSGWNSTKQTEGDEVDDAKARSAIIFVSTCERAAMVSGILSEVGVKNVALHSLLSQNRRLAALGKFKSQQVRVLVATDVASRGLDIPSVDLVLNAELPRNAVSYVHRVGRTARAGRRGRAVSFVAETDVALVHAAERVSGRPLEKCTDITDDMAIKMLGPVTKAARLSKMKLLDIGFDDLVKKMKERKARDRKDRERLERALQRSNTGPSRRNKKSSVESE